MAKRAGCFVWLSSWCIVTVVAKWLFLTVPSVGLQFFCSYPLTFVSYCPISFGITVRVYLLLKINIEMTFTWILSVRNHNSIPSPKVCRL